MTFWEASQTGDKYKKEKKWNTVKKVIRKEKENKQTAQTQT